MDSYQLPPEIWLEVFNWATYYPSSDAYTTEYKPFSTSTSQATDVALQVKCILTLVCREWHTIVTEFLYKDVRIGRGQNALKCALNDGNRRFVRRAVLPYHSTSTPEWNPDPLPSIEILKLCNKLEILVRPPSPPLETQRFEFDADNLTLPSLKRLEWTYNFEAERTGGINSLQSVLQGSPFLQYLSINSVSRSPRARLAFDSRAVSLPYLETLSLSALNPSFLYQIAGRWSLPSLSHLMLGSLYVEDLTDLWETYSEQLRVLELGKDSTFLLQDAITPCLERCTKLEELNFHVFYTLPPQTTNTYPSVTAIGLHSAEHSMFDSETSWKLLEKHLDVLCGDTFPSLHSLHLFGEWTSFLHHPRFAPFATRLYQRGVKSFVKD
ncbi:hypothetical protein K435DRAFT_655366 [Dendrothele bispora CBS 962.96]|uniref:Uncharacterized protein n=1 Tax=Dendrothele bispora (strain CBS 962.96) TaxID=1314807 RepID=A0A4S8MGU8_DENBC|nr:hypothetical protein K435DRAFT_655366 [Dendrothele bispora CBS 962.96]